jgi:hypothetical protein
MSIPLASDLFLSIDYNDTNPMATNSVINVTLPYSGTYTYFSPGIYTVNVTVHNHVSVLKRIINIAINAPFLSYTSRLCYLLPLLTSSLDDICNLQIVGGRYYIPKQSQLVTYVAWNNPSKIIIQ